MDYRMAGATGISVSEIGMGTWEFGGREWGDISEEISIDVMRYGFEQGITFFDTADAYGPDGLSERLIGRAFAGHSENIVVATKVGYPLGMDGWIAAGGEHPPHDLSRTHILSACEDSLRRLQRERIEFYNMHRPPPPDEWDEAFGAMETLKRQGKIANYGVALGGVAEALRAVREAGATVVMLPYNCLDQSRAGDLLPVALELGVAVLARQVMAQGLLGGQLTAETEFAANDYRRTWAREDYLENLRRVERLQFLVRNDAASLPQAALRFALAHPAISTVVTGMMRREEVDQNVKASGAPLPEADVQRVRELYQAGFV